LPSGYRGLQGDGKGRGAGTDVFNTIEASKGTRKGNGYIAGKGGIEDNRGALKLSRVEYNIGIIQPYSNDLT
jgi:hypothetical protein